MTQLRTLTSFTVDSYIVVDGCGGGDGDVDGRYATVSTLVSSASIVDSGRPLNEALHRSSWHRWSGRGRVCVCVFVCNRNVCACVCMCAVVYSNLMLSTKRWPIDIGCGAIWCMGCSPKTYSLWWRGP